MDSAAHPRRGLPFFIATNPRRAALAMLAVAGIPTGVLANLTLAGGLVLVTEARLDGLRQVARFQERTLGALKVIGLMVGHRSEPGKDLDALERDIAQAVSDRNHLADTVVELRERLADLSAQLARARLRPERSAFQMAALCRCERDSGDHANAESNPARPCPESGCPGFELHPPMEPAQEQLADQAAGD